MNQADQNELNITSHEMQMLDKMIEVYETNTLSEENKGFLASRMLEFLISVTVDLRIEKPNKDANGIS